AVRGVASPSRQPRTPPYDACRASQSDVLAGGLRPVPTAHGDALAGTDDRRDRRGLRLFRRPQEVVATIPNRRRARAGAHPDVSNRVIRARAAFAGIFAQRFLDHRADRGALRTDQSDHFRRIPAGVAQRLRLPLERSLLVVAYRGL